ncbi:MAG: ATP-dependent sacrificial sulfur transferase LarE [Candidatus Firestonebacteria bacterium]
MNKKLGKLKNILKKMSSVLVAYSGGVDSTFLLKVALDTLGKNNVFAVMAKSETYPSSEIKYAINIAKFLGAEYSVIKTNELKDKRFVKNPINRCYYCKKELFSRLKNIAKKLKINCVVDGTNYDDRLDIRPGALAGEKLGIESPLKEAKMTKKDIRKLSKNIGLSTWDKPSFACLSSRIPYGDKIDVKVLRMIDAAEKFLKEFGFAQVRVRHHNNMARIELGREDIKKVLKNNLTKKIAEKLKKIGYNYITLDLEGYRTGSMNLVRD